MTEKSKVRFKHWINGEELSAIGEIISVVSPQSDRIVVLKDDGWYEDILKNTIIDITPL